MDIVGIALQVVVLLTSILLVLLILLHKGQGSGLSDMFGGGVSASMGGSSVAERNLNRLTIFGGSLWILAVVGLGIVARFS